LAKRYDFLVIDHPWAGFAARTGVILPLDQLLPKGFIADQEYNSVGKSHESYHYDGQQWALAIDAATPVAASRMDLLEKENIKVPEDWSDLVALAKKGKVLLPGIPQDTLMSFYMVCCTLGEEVCLSEEYIISEMVGLEALDLLRDLGQHIAKESYDLNPIKVYERLSTGNDFCHSPFAYGYANYARAGYAAHRLYFHEMAAIAGQPLITTLGGTGLAISAKCRYTEVAAAYLQYTASPKVQKGLFFDTGGQPGHRTAWQDEYTNDLTNQYFKNTLPALKRAFLRPRYHGHLHFQDNAGAPIRQYMMQGGDPKSLLGKLNELYHKSLK
ncbi:MAG: extracellular solute-binding protein, partial [Bacteroidota bacterium]